MRGLSGMVLTMVLAGCASGGAGGDGGATKVAALKLDALRTMDGATVDLDAALERGETVALVFWQTWCGSCKAEAPGVVRAQRLHSDKIQFLGVIPGRDDTVDDAEVSETARAWGYGFSQVRDRDLSLTRGLGVSGTPRIIVLGKDRQVLYDAHRLPYDWAGLEGVGSSALPPGDSLSPPRDSEDAPASQPATHTDESALLLRERKLAVMGTDLLVEVLGPDERALEEALDAAVAELRRVEDVFTTRRPSPLNRLNSAAGKGPQPATEEVVGLLSRSVEIGRLTGGAFDVSFAGVGKLWNFRARPPRIPSKDEVTQALERVGYARIGVDLEARTVTIPAGMRIGLGGIAKGFGVDRAMAVLMRRGIRHALVNAGGDLKAVGRKHGKTWQIAIKHPRDRERLLAVLPVSNTCVVTSGDYERFFLQDGRRYHHIIDPRTGYPSRGCMSATVVAPDAAFADALATALCVLDPEEGLALVAKLKRVEALLVGMDGEVHVSPGLKTGTRRR